MSRGYSLTSKETAAVSVAVGFGFAAVAGLGLGAALGAGVYSLSTGTFNKDKKDPLSERHIKRDSEGRITSWSQVLKLTQQAGISPNIRAEVWPLLLGVYSPTSTTAERASELTRLHRLYTKLVLVCEELNKELEATKAAAEQAKQKQLADQQQQKHGKMKHSSSKHHKKGNKRSNNNNNTTGGGGETKNNPTSTKSSTKATPPPSPSKEPPPLPGNLAAFAEAHRIIVMDALRTDLSVRPDGRTSMNLSSDGDGGSNTSARSHSNNTAAAKINSFFSSSSRGHNRTNTGSTSSGSNNGNSGSSRPNTLSSSNNGANNNNNQQQQQPTVTVLPVACSDGIPELMLVQPPPEQPLSPSAAVAEGRLPVWRSELAASTIDEAGHVSFENKQLMMRLVNVLSAYSVHDPETGYCQGMSDLAAVFVQLFDDDALAFACFERFMRSARRNFKHDETGIRRQLAQIGRILADTDPTLHTKLQALHADDCTFAYRMVVVMLRRELPLQQAATLWEVQWALEAAAAAEQDAAAVVPQSGIAALDLTNSPSSSTAVTKERRSPSPPATASSRGIAATVQSMDAAAREAITGGQQQQHSSSLSTAMADVDKESSQSSLSSPTHASSIKKLGSGGSMSLTSRTSSKGGAVRGSTGGGDQREPPPDFLLQFIAAAVRAQRVKILNECRDTDDVLRLFNTVKIDFWTALAQARKQYKAYAQGLAVLQRL